MQIPFVIIIVIAVVAMLIWQRKHLKKSLEENKDKNFGSVAARLGMQVTEGEGGTNLLYFMEKRGNYERKLRASGKPYAHTASFIVMDGLKTNDYLVYRRITHSFGCYLDVKLLKPTAPFEVVLRNPNQYLIPNQDMANRSEVLEVPSGDAALDAQFLIRAADPSIAAKLVPALQILSQQVFIHLAGEGDQLWINFTRIGLPYMASAAEEYMLALETAACSLEGQPLPARIGAQGAAPKALAQ